MLRLRYFDILDVKREGNLLIIGWSCPVCSSFNRSESLTGSRCRCRACGAIIIKEVDAWQVEDV